MIGHSLILDVSGKSESLGKGIAVLVGTLDADFASLRECISRMDSSDGVPMDGLTWTDTKSP